MVEFMNPSRWRRARGATLGGVLVAATVLAGGCSGTLEDVWPDQRSSYKSSRSTPPLEVPPDLTSTSIRDSLQIPGADPTYSQYASGAAGTRPQAAPEVLPEIEDARIERSGDQRWLVVAMKPDETWPRLRDFWTAQGFALATEEPGHRRDGDGMGDPARAAPRGCNQESGHAHLRSALRCRVPRSVPDPHRAGSPARYDRGLHFAPRRRAGGGWRRDPLRAGRGSRRACMAAPPERPRA